MCLHCFRYHKLSDDDLIKLSDKLFKYYEKLRLKAIDLDYHFTDEDWFNLLEIIDEFEFNGNSFYTLAFLTGTGIDSSDRATITGHIK